MICHLGAAADNSDSGGGPEVTHQPLGCVGLLGVGLVGKAALGIDQRAGVVGVGDAGRGGGELRLAVVMLPQLSNRKRVMPSSWAGSLTWCG